MADLFQDWSAERFAERMAGGNNDAARKWKLIQALYDALADVTATDAELNKLSGATVTTGELNLLDGAPANVTIAYAASVTTDGIEATFTVVDAAGVAIAAIHTLNVWISDDADGSGLTATTASGALTAATGTILTALTAVKHVIANTDENGVLTLLLVDEANTADERFCVAHPLTSRAIVGDATVAADYEGGGA